MAPQHGTSLLDLGCGDGHLLESFAAQVSGGCVVGVDITPAMQQTATQRMQNSARVNTSTRFFTLVADINRNSTPAAVQAMLNAQGVTNPLFDFIVCDSVLTHVPSDQHVHFLDLWEPYLKPEGRFIFSRAFHPHIPGRIDIARQNTAMPAAHLFTGQLAPSSLYRRAADEVRDFLIPSTRQLEFSARINPQALFRDIPGQPTVQSLNVLAPIQAVTPNLQAQGGTLSANNYISAFTTSNPYPQMVAKIAAGFHQYPANTLRASAYLVEAVLVCRRAAHPRKVREKKAVLVSQKGKQFDGTSGKIPPGIDPKEIKRLMSLRNPDGSFVHRSVICRPGDF
jgi:SAM-dependent methyltransferase